MDVSDGQIEIYIWDIFCETIIPGDERGPGPPLDKALLVSNRRVFVRAISSHLEM